ncbi:MAG: hypothetical protein IKS48_00010 [Eubacterium sp.]|nr:hypothetical protein [Eubacterium sp.]
MNRKYMLRGIGIGIIIGALVMYSASMTFGEKKPSAKADAASVTTEVTTKVTTEVTTAAKTEATTETKTTEVASGDDATTASDTEAVTEEKTTEKKTTEEKTTEKKEEKTTEAKTEATTEQTSDEVVTITVEPGMGSEDVAALLKDAGLIDDAAAFDQWLIDNGYESRLSVGSFEIMRGSTNEEIAKALTSAN